MKDRRLSLSRELWEIQCAVEGARILADEIRQDHLPTIHDEREAPRCVAAVLNLVGARLHNLGRVVEGDLDPILLFEPYNEIQQEDPDPVEVVLRAWPDERRAERAEAELARIRKRSLRGSRR